MKPGPSEDLVREAFQEAFSGQNVKPFKKSITAAVAANAKNPQVNRLIAEYGQNRVWPVVARLLKKGELSSMHQPLSESAVQSRVTADTVTQTEHGPKPGLAVFEYNLENAPQNRGQDEGALRGRIDASQVRPSRGEEFSLTFTW